MAKWGLLLAALVYAVYPLDLLPDVVPLVGWLDDAIVLAMALRGLSRARHAPAIRARDHNRA